MDKFTKWPFQNFTVSFEGITVTAEVDEKDGGFLILITAFKGDKWWRWNGNPLTNPEISQESLGFTADDVALFYMAKKILETDFENYADFDDFPPLEKQKIKLWEEEIASIFDRKVPLIEKE